jgi:putative methionine-R-sulfoxide reductase with GAF domain
MPSRSASAGLRTREYQSLLASLRSGAGREQTMRGAADALWEALHPTGVSWVGFYIFDPGCVVHADGRREDGMILGARRDKPACSPIGLHGACGRCYLSRRSLVVTDVARLGAGYIACDPRDRSEVVVPLFEPDGTAWGVLDADSYDPGAFDKADADSLLAIMKGAGLSRHRVDIAVEVV